MELAEGKPTRKHIEFALHRVRMLIHFGVTPYIVFDGDYLPSKAHTEKERAAKRKESRRVGLELLRMGRPSQAQLELQKAVDVTPLMARELIEELKLLDVPYIVAPYEADSQLAYLEKKGVISGVLSEDSDLLVFGVKCLLTKLDQYGECVMINRDNFTACKDISLVDWTEKEFRVMAMLSGCDYLPGIINMGLKTAYRLVRKHKTVEKVIRAVQFEGKMRVPVGYIEAFANAERTFVHSWAYCPDSRCLQNLTPLPRGASADSMPYIGKYVEPTLAVGVASGDLDPNTKLAIVLPSRYKDQAHRSRIVHTPIEKHGKPITDFFKAYRQPLSELDPNGFSLSPSQIQLSESQRNTSWSAVPSSAPQATRRVSHAPVLQMVSPKRQRLCSDVPLTRPSSMPLTRLATDSAIAAAMGAPPITSRFFAKPTAQASPTLRKKSNRKQEEFDLWSDDSIAEAVATATKTPEPTQSVSTVSSRKRKKISILVDPDAALMDDSIDDVSQDSVLTVATPQSQASVNHDTPDTSFECSVSPPPEKSSILNKGVRTGLSAFRFEELSSSQQNMSWLRMKSAQISRIPQRSHRQTSNRSPSVAVSEFVPNSSPPVAIETTFRSDIAEPDDDTVNDDECHTEKLTARTIAVSKGSEDMIVPNSPEGDEDHPALDLSKYLFAG